MKCMGFNTQFCRKGKKITILTAEGVEKACAAAVLRELCFVVFGATKVQYLSTT